MVSEQKSREIVQATKTPNSRYHHMTGFVVGETMVGADTGTEYVTVVWITKPSVTGDKRQVMNREYLSTIGYEDPSVVIVEEPDEPSPYR